MAFKHDLFVSYAAATNDLPHPCEQWVSRLVDGLGKMLRARMGGRGAKIYFDERTIEPNQSLDQILDEVRASRFFLAISSSAYNSRPWPKRELDTFLSAADASSRLFVISAEPVSNDQLLLPLRERHRSIFHDPFDQGSSRLPPPFEPDSKRFFECLWDLAVSMGSRLNTLDEGMSNVGDPAARRTPHVPSGAPQKTVLLCQTTEDLEGELASLRRALGQQPSLRVLPEHTYPQSAAEFRSAYKLDLAQSDFVVQLLSPVRGRTLPDLPEGYVRFQAEEAKRSKVSLLQWRRSDVLLENVIEADHRELLEGETVTACTLPTFVKDLIENLTAPALKAVNVDNGARSIVFVNADKADLPAAMQCGSALAKDFDVILPPTEDEEKGASVQDEFNNCLTAADAIFLIQGSSGANWVRSQLTQALKVRSLKHREIVGAVLHGPPKGKRPINMLIKGVEELDCTSEDGTGWRFDGIERVIKSPREV